MASVLNKDVPEEFKFMADYWNFRKRFYIPEMDDSYWTQLFEEAEALMYKYDPGLINNPAKESFYGDMVRTCVKDLERRYKAHE